MFQLLHLFTCRLSVLFRWPICGLHQRWRLTLDPDDWAGDRSFEGYIILSSVCCLSAETVQRRKYIRACLYQKLLNCHLPWLHINMDHWCIYAAGHRAVLFVLLRRLKGEKKIPRNQKVNTSKKGHCFVMTSVIPRGSTPRCCLKAAIQILPSPPPPLPSPRTVITLWRNHANAD